MLLTETFNNMADDVVKAMEDQKKKAEAEPEKEAAEGAESK